MTQTKTVALDCTELVIQACIFKEGLQGAIRMSAKAAAEASGAFQVAQDGSDPERIEWLSGIMEAHDLFLLRHHANGNFLDKP